ncbi:thiamine-phosphate kinase [Lacisediminimonas sp.]|uniref:thiamine-phosphate kinase n=1 Tax=Lacisediminimonas sp. TaxID=3060582 RepID=UPI0027222D73|nr:thiamine-phosphate kinase [Lacisediminimonas sp.]MDO8299284.1 thiamine-phosphate kinase [Lacisediminimonas sp.]
MLSEFDLIARYFKRPLPAGSRTAVGIGDDCALLAPAPGMHLAISCDMLVEGRHFFPDVDVASLGHKSLAVNLSDLAAMGAQPLAFTLALSLPSANEAWLAAFSDGLFALADQFACPLIGGDTTRGPLNICITVLGEVPLAQALRRSAACVGDDIWVSGSFGEARLALAAHLNEIELETPAMQQADARLLRPTPRVLLGTALRGIAHAAIDISDGLCGDLGHILEQAKVGATINVDAVPTGAALHGQSLERRRHYTLAGGDDYELCFTAPASARNEVLAAAGAAATPVTRIGVIDSAPGLRLQDARAQPVQLVLHSFDHFK